LAFQNLLQGQHYPGRTGIRGNQSPLNGKICTVYPGKAQQSSGKANVGLWLGLPNQAAKPLPALPKACPDGNALQPLHSLGNQIAKAEGAAERKGNEAALSWTQHFPNPR